MAKIILILDGSPTHQAALANSRSPQEKRSYLRREMLGAARAKNVLEWNLLFEELHRALIDPATIFHAREWRRLRRRLIRGY